MNAETLESQMEYGEEEYDGNGDLDDQGIDLSLLRLSSFNSNSNSNSNSAIDRRNQESSILPHPHSVAGEQQSLSPPILKELPGSPAKGPSPEHNDNDDHHPDEPRRKKQSLLQREDSDFLQSGYSKIQIPNGSNHYPTRNHTRNSTRPSKLLKRSLSDSYASPVKSSTRNGNISHEIQPLNSPSSIVKGINGGCSSSSLPPRPPGLFRRCVSDPTNSSPAKFLSRSTSSCSSEESLKSNEMLKIIKEGALKMNEWFDMIVQFGEGSVEGEPDASRVTEEVETEEENDETREEFKEGVRVERTGEGFVLKLNCPCGKAYRILFSGNDCYYKLL